MHLFIGQIWCRKCEMFNLYSNKRSKEKVSSRRYLCCYFLLLCAWFTFLFLPIIFLIYFSEGGTLQCQKFASAS